jgi:hypothetical protein
MKNKQKTACIFPETVPGDEILFPLAQVFARLVYCQAVENDEIPAQLASELREQLEQAGLAEVHVPAPLGEDRDRFVALIHDLTSRPGDYAAQLKHLSLAGIGQSGRRGEETKGSIITTLMGTGFGSKAGPVGEEEQLLWQARLVLKLGEIFDAGQVDLRREMERIEAREKGLLAELRREEPQPFNLTRQLQIGEGSMDGMPRLRLKAWSRLFCLGSEKREDFTAFITASQDGFDLLVEEYEREKEGQARTLIDILLPARPGGGDPLAGREELARAGGDYLEAIGRSLADPGGAIDELTSALADPGGPWADLLESVYPEAACGRVLLHLSFFGSVAPCRLFMAAFGRDERGARGLAHNNDEAGCVIGWLAEAGAQGA